MRILLTNDDGIVAPGLSALYDVLAQDAEVDVVAPQVAHSGGSHSITIRHPLIWQRININGRFCAAGVEGTPADCVKLAVNALLPQKPDLVVSGINAGLNTGTHVIYSGTVAAAIEAAMLGLPAMAVSLQVSDHMEFDRAARIARRVMDQFLQHGPCPGHVWNVNIPELKPGRPRGVRVAPQSTRTTAERMEKRTDPNGRAYYWLTGDFADLSDDGETDRAAVRNGYVSITPLHFDLTDGALLRDMRHRSWPDLD